MTTQHSTQHFILGIDISKARFDVALLKPDGKYKTKAFSNQPKGFAELLSWLAGHRVESVHACLEATNVYGEALATALYDHAHQVSVVNPLKIKGFAQSELSRTKTDQQDAKLIARFCQAMRPALWEPEPLKVRALKAMVKRLDALVTMHQQELNRQAVADRAVQGGLEDHIVYLEQQMARLRAQIDQHIDDDPDLKQQKKQLLSIPGIGPTSSSYLLAHFSTIKAFGSAKQMASFCGVAPAQRQSGSSLKGQAHLSKVGPPGLRKALFFPAMVALRYNPVLIALNERLTERGKPKMVIIGAAMRKLVHIIYGVLKNNTLFDPTLAYHA